MGGVTKRSVLVLQPVFGFGAIDTQNSRTVYAADSVSGTTTYTIQTVHITDGKFFLFYDDTGNAGTNNITINTQGSELISGEANYTIAVDYGWTWMVARAGNLVITG